MVNWDSIDTVLLDMDGTLLDLNFDNTLWNELVPGRYAAARGISIADARTKLFAKMRETDGQLNFYCLDYWTNFTQLDIAAMHSELAHLIAYRPNARALLAQLRAQGKHAMLVTNAHRHSLNIKDQHSQLLSQLDDAVSCHDYGTPKESPEFWPLLHRHYPYDPTRTLLIDDNAAVLQAAEASGILNLLTIQQPDLARQPRSGLAYRPISNFREILSCE